VRVKVAARYFSDSSVNLLIRAFLKFYLETGNYGKSVIYLVRELYLGDRQGSFSLLER